MNSDETFSAIPDYRGCFCRGRGGRVDIYAIVATNDGRERERECKLRQSGG